MRTESSMKKVYEILGQSPCPDDLSHWKYRDNDYELFDYNRNLKLSCAYSDEVRLIEQDRKEDIQHCSETIYIEKGLDSRKKVTFIKAVNQLRSVTTGNLK
jgi:hypothetical protein